MKKGYLLTAVWIGSFLISIQAMAARDDFTPSVSGKLAPTIAADDTGAPAAQIYDRTDSLVANIPVGAIIVTALAEADQAVDREMAERLVRVYSELQDMPTLEHLSEELNAAMAAEYSDKSAADLIISDYFDVSVYGIYRDYIETEGNYLKITFESSMKPSDTLYILHHHDGKWKMADRSYVTIDENGGITARFDNLCPMAFLTGRPLYQTVNAADPQVKSPQTWEQNVPSRSVWFAVMLLCTLSACICFFSVWQKDEEEKIP